jgi:hypothetical protein
MITKGSTVTAHTGSTKTHTYRLVTGTVVGFEPRMVTSTHYVLEYVIQDAEGNLYRESLGRLTEVETPEPAKAPEAPQPRAIRFESVTCYRCEGERRNPMWGKVGGGWCFQCGGAGWLRTQAGKEAEAAYERLRDERLGARVGDIAVGEVFKLNGKFYEKTERTRLHADYPVHRHHGATTRQIWREIAARYKGATLVY